MRTLLLVCLLAVPAYSQSKLPPKGPPVTVKKGAEGATSEDKARKGQEPSKDKALPSENQKIAKTVETKANEELETSRKIADYTGQLATFTKFLVGVGALQLIALIGQGIVFYRALKENRRLIAAATQSADAAQQSAIATQQYARTTIESNALTRESNDITRKATDLTNQSVVLTHRPRLIVRNVALDDEENILHWRTGTKGGNPIPATGTLRIVNVGSSQAHIISWQCSVLMLKQLPSRWPLMPMTDRAAHPIKLPAGVYWTTPFPTTAQDDFTPDELFGLWKQELSLFVIGQMVYEDDLRNVRTTWFCRRGIYGNSRFTPEQDADYESAD